MPSKFLILFSCLIALCLLPRPACAVRGSGLYSSRYDTLIVGMKGTEMILKKQITNQNLVDGLISDGSGNSAGCGQMQGVWFDVCGNTGTGNLTIKVLENPDLNGRVGYFYAKNSQTPARWDTITIIQPAQRCMPVNTSSQGTNFVAAFSESQSADGNIALFLYATASANANINVTHGRSTANIAGTVWNNGANGTRGKIKSSVAAYKIDTVYYESFAFVASGRGIYIPNTCYPENNEPPNTPLAYNYNAENAAQANSLFIESDQPISLYGYNAGSMSSDAANILPLEVLGNEYFTMSYNSSPQVPTTPEEFLVVATEDNTIVTIVPKGNTTKANFSHADCRISGNTCSCFGPSTPNNTLVYTTKSLDANDPFTIRLNRGSTYLVKAQLTGISSSQNYIYTNSLTGSYIKANKTIAVFAGHRRASVGRDGPRDNLYEQLLPVEFWGTQYIAVNTTQYNLYTQQRLNDYDNICRIIAANDNTNVSVVDSLGVRSTYTLQRGAYREIPLTRTQKYLTITSSAPISVGLFEESANLASSALLPGSQYPGGTGDPFLLMLSPLSNGVRHTTFSPFPLFARTTDTNNRHYVTIFAESAHKDFTILTMQGTAVRDTIQPLQWVNMNNGYSYATKEIKYQSQYNYHIDNPYGTTSFAFGHGSAESYGYLLGMSYSMLSDEAVRDSSFCYGDNAAATYLHTSYDGRGIWYYNSYADWENGNPQPPPAIDPSSDSTYRIYYSLAQPCCPDHTDACKQFYPYPREAKIRILPQPKITFRDDTICLAAPANYGALPAGGVYEYQSGGAWLPFNHRQAGVGTYQVRYTYPAFYNGDTIPGGSKQCQFSAQATIKVQTPQAQLTMGNVTFCYGDSVILQASGTGIDSIVWRYNDTENLTQPVANDISRYVVKPSGTKYQSGRYAAYAYDQCGCYDTAVVQVNIVDPPPAPIILSNTGGNAYCVGDSLLLTATPMRNDAYLWYRAGAATGNTLASYLSKETIGGAYRYVVAAGNNLSNPSSHGIQCWSRDTFDVQVNALPVLYQINITRQQSAICSAQDSIKLSAALLATSIPAATYEWKRDDGNLPPYILPNYTADFMWAKNGGTYSAVAISAAGCRSNIANRLVESRNMPQVPNIAAGQSVCQDSAQLLRVQIAYPREIYRWCYGDSMPIPATAAASQYRAYSAGSYVVRADLAYSDGLTCTAYSAPLVVAMHPKPMPPLIHNAARDSNCDAQPITLQARQPSGDASSVRSYLWYRADTIIVPHNTSSAMYTARGSAEYRVKAFSNYGCESEISQPKRILIDPPEEVKISPRDYSVCGGGNVTLSCAFNSAEFAYQWYKNGAAIAGETTPMLVVSTPAANPAPDNYHISVRIPRCASPFQSNSATINIRERPPQPIINGGKSDSAICAGNDFTLHAESAGSVRYFWYKNGALDTIIEGSPDYVLPAVQAVDIGAYSVETENTWAQILTNCRSPRSQPFRLDVLPLPEVRFTSLAACSNETMFTAVEPSGGVFACPRGCENPDFFNPSTALSSRMVRYTYTASNGCALTAQGLVAVTTQPAVPVIEAAPPTMFCAGTAIATTLQYNASAGYALQWYRNNVPIIDAVMSSIRVTTEGIYSLTARNGNCPAATPSNEIAVAHYPALPAPIIVPANPAFCPNSDVRLSAQSAASGAYEWYLDNAVIAGASDNFYVANAEGAYSVRMLDANSCWTAMSAAVAAYRYPAFNPRFTDTAACERDAAFIAVEPQGGEFSCAVGCENSAYFNPSAARRDARITYTYSHADCTESVARTIKVWTIPVVPMISSHQALIACAEGDIAIELAGNSSSDYGFRWYKDGAPIPNGDSMNYRARSSGAYDLLVSNGRCAADRRSNVLTIDEFPRTEPPVVRAADSGFCPDGSARIYSEKPSAGYFEWVKIINGEPQTIDGAMDVSYRTSEVGTFSARWRDANGCLTAVGNAVRISLFPLPVKPQIRSPVSQYYYELNYTLTLTPIIAGVRYAWYRGGDSVGAGAEYAIRHLRASDTGAYVVSAVNTYGCRIRSDTFAIKSPAHRFFIPTIFTPNGDGINDYFEIVGLDGFAETKLKILNKNGIIIYSVSNYANDWDGSGLPSDVYFYQLEVRDKDGNTRNHNGYVHLKR